MDIQDMSKKEIEEFTGLTKSELKQLNKPRLFSTYVDSPTNWQSDDQEKRLFKPK